MTDWTKTPSSFLEDVKENLQNLINNEELFCHLEELNSEEECFENINKNMNILKSKFNILNIVENPANRSNLAYLEIEQYRDVFFEVTKYLKNRIPEVIENTDDRKYKDKEEHQDFVLSLLTDLDYANIMKSCFDIAFSVNTMKEFEKNNQQYISVEKKVNTLH